MSRSHLVLLLGALAAQCGLLLAIWLWPAAGGSGIFAPPPRAWREARDRFPDAAQAWQMPGFRCAGVHYWQGGWSASFWPELDLQRVDADLRRIRELSFNTVLLTVPWGTFQPAIEPVRYDAARFRQLQALVRTAAAHRLYVALRVGSLERVPEGVAGGPYSAPHAFFVARELHAYAGLLQETARALRAERNVLFLFTTWEDLSGYLFAARADAAERARTGAAIGRELPAHGSQAFGEFLTLADRRWQEHVLPLLRDAARRGDPQVRLGHEVRIDSDPILDGAAIRWFDHDATWSLPEGYDVVLAYFNPSLGAQNAGESVTAADARRTLRELVTALQGHAGRRPVFFDQLNFVDTTPAFRRNARLADEDEIARFLDGALPHLFARTLGCALWTLDSYEASVVGNGSFRAGLASWRAQGPVELGEDRERDLPFAALGPGASLTQAIDAPWNPGLADPTKPFTLRLQARGPSPLRVLVRSESGGVQLEGDVPPSAQWQRHEFRLPAAARCELTFAAPGPRAELAAVVLCNHVQEAALFDAQRRPLGSRPQVFASHQREVLARIGALPGVPSTESLAGGEAIELLLPWQDNELELVLPPGLHAPCSLTLDGREIARLGPGASGGQVAAPRSGPGRRILRAVAEERPIRVQRGSVVPPGARERRRWQLQAGEPGRALWLAAQAQDDKGAPLAGATVFAHRGGEVVTARTAADGAAGLRVPGDDRNTAVAYVELLDPRGSLTVRVNNRDR
jgi:hypothetical protein